MLYTYKNIINYTPIINIYYEYYISDTILIFNHNVSI